MATKAMNFDKAPPSKFGLQTEIPGKVFVWVNVKHYDEGKRVLLKDFTSYPQFLQRVGAGLQGLQSPAIHHLCTPGGRKISGFEDMVDGGNYIAVPTGFKFDAKRVPEKLLEERRAEREARRAALEAETAGETSGVSGSSS